ncbi:hypothetical protein ABK040_014716 [Willaertia magna]
MSSHYGGNFSPHQKKNEMMFKIILVGDSSVGKTSLILRYNTNKFKPQHPTIGATFSTKKLKVDQNILTLQIWDTAGQERFRSMIPMYYRNAACAVVCFDCSRKQTAESVKNWIKDVKMHADDDILLAIICTKVDMLKETKEWKKFMKTASSASLPPPSMDSSIHSNITTSNSYPNIPFGGLLSSASGHEDAITSSILTHSVYSPTHSSPSVLSTHTTTSNTSSVNSIGSSSPNSVVDCEVSFDLTSHPFYEMISYAKQVGALYFETSSKTNEGIDDMFLTISRKLIEKTKLRKQQFDLLPSLLKDQTIKPNEEEDFSITTTSSTSTTNSSQMKPKQSSCCGGSTSVNSASKVATSASSLPNNNKTIGTVNPYAINR